MSSIKINNAINSLNTEAIVNNFFANAKRAFQPFVREQVKQLRSMQLFKDNLNFKYSGEDLLKASYKTSNNLSILESNGYKNCSEKYFLNAEYNCIESSETLHSFKSNIEPQVIPFFDGFETKNANYIFDEDSVTFFEKTTNNIFLSFRFNDAEIVDLLIQNDFVYAIIKHNENYFLCLSHIGLTLPSDSFSFKSFDCFYKISLGDYTHGFFLMVDSFEIIILDNDGKYRSLKLGKKYFFEFDGFYYYNSSVSEGILNDIAILKTVQNESLFLYDIADLFGLSDFVDLSKNKVFDSTIIKSKEHFFKKTFTDNYNGMLNFCDFLLPKKSYFFDFDGDYISFSDNFLDFDNYGFYKIQVSSSAPKRFEEELITYNLSLFYFDSGSFKLLEKKKVTTSSLELYFKNIKIKIKNLSVSAFSESAVFNVQDDLTCKLSFSEKRVTPVLFEDTNNFYLKQASSYFSLNKKLPFYLSNSLDNNELKDFLIGSEVYDLKLNEVFMAGDKKFSFVAPKKIEKNVSFNAKIEKVKKFKVKRIRFRLDISNL